MSRTRKPVSAQQLAANRANAARSTGPRTPAGKVRSTRNSRQHGFTASTFAIVRLEELQEVAHLKADLLSAYQPVNSQELFAIERIALSQQALLRAARLEAGLFTTCLNEALDPSGQPLFLMNQDLTADLEITRAQNRNYALGEGFHRMAKTATSWSLFLRYQAQAERHYRRAVEEFERLKALRQELPNEPIFDLQPEPNKPTSTPLPTNPNPPGAAPFAPRSEAPAAPARAPLSSRSEPDSAVDHLPAQPAMPASPGLERSSLRANCRSWVTAHSDVRRRVHFDETRPNPKGRLSWADCPFPRVFDRKLTHYRIIKLMGGEHLALRLRIHP